MADRSSFELLPVSSSSQAPPLVHPTPCWAGTAVTVSHPTSCTACFTPSPPSSSPPKTVVRVTPSSPLSIAFSESWPPSSLYTPTLRPLSRFISLERFSSFLGSPLFFCRSSLEERRRCDKMISAADVPLPFLPSFITCLAGCALAVITMRRNRDHHKNRECTNFAEHIPSIKLYFFVIFL